MSFILEYGDEVRILIFDDPAELESWQRPVVVRSGRGPFRPTRARPARAMHGRARAMHEFFFENLRNPALVRCAGLMPQFCPAQLNSTRIHACTKFSIPTSIRIQLYFSAMFFRETPRGSSPDATFAIHEVFRHKFIPVY